MIRHLILLALTLLTLVGPVCAAVYCETTCRTVSGRTVCETWCQ
jgi:hypothetical protein